MRDHSSCAHNLSSAKVKAWVKSFLFNTDIFILDNFLLARLKAVVSYFNDLFIYFNIIEKDKNTYQTKLEINVMITMELITTDIFSMYMRNVKSDKIEPTACFLSPRATRQIRPR